MRRQARPLYGRYLDKTDNPTNRQTKRALDQYFQTSTGLFLPSSEAGSCGGCGIELYRTKTDFWFNEKFCSLCVEAWKHGATR